MKNNKKSKSRKKFGHYCRICGKRKPNEKFSGKGHKTHVCKKCASLPIEERNRREFLEEIYGYWQQSNISKKNIERLKILQESTIIDVAELSNAVLEVAKLYPFKKKRIRKIAKENKELIPKLEHVGLIINWNYNHHEELYDDEYLLDEIYYDSRNDSTISEMEHWDDDIPY